MKRRTFITSSIGLGMVAQLPFIGAVNADMKKGAAVPLTTTPLGERELFIKIAKDKGVNVFFDQPAPIQITALKELHLDMNMVRASIGIAIARTKTNNPLISQKLARLLAQGTAVQQVDFVHGSGSYYFPEEVEAAIVQSESVHITEGVQCWICEPVCMTVCACLGNGDQYCKDKCRDVCHKYC
jgi:hypothetical protein